jgi:hypothetical protein
MRRSALIAPFMAGLLSLAVLASTPLHVVLAHEQHKMECNGTSINAMEADIQAMSDGDAKMTAMQEMDMAKDMMTKGNIDSCVAHIHKAMEAVGE